MDPNITLRHRYESLASSKQVYNVTSDIPNQGRELGAMEQSARIIWQKKKGETKHGKHGEPRTPTLGSIRTAVTWPEQRSWSTFLVRHLGLVLIYIT